MARARVLRCATASTRAAASSTSPRIQTREHAQDAACGEEGDGDVEAGRAVLFVHDALQSVTGDGDDQIDAGAGPRRPGASVGDQVGEVLHEIVAVVAAEAPRVEADQGPVDAGGGRTWSGQSGAQVGAGDPHQAGEALSFGGADALAQTGQPVVPATLIVIGHGTAAPTLRPGPGRRGASASRTGWRDPSERSRPKSSRRPA